MRKTWTSEDKKLFVDQKTEKEPHWSIQVLFLIIWTVALWAACYL